LKSYIIFA